MIPTIDIVIVNWNTGKQLFECLQSLGTCERDKILIHEIIVVDNLSSDDSPDNIPGIEIPIRVVRNSSNLGFARACNIGAEISSADYLLFLNPDTKVFPESIQTPMLFMNEPENHKIGVVGIQIIDELNKISKTCARIPSGTDFIYTSLGLHKILPNLFPDYVLHSWDHNSNRLVEHVMGSYYLIRRHLFQELNGFDEQFFVYLEDLDLSARVLQKGYSIYYLSTVQIFHKGGGASENVKAQRLSYVLRSKLTFYKNHLSLGFRAINFFVTLTIEPFARIFGAVLRRSFSEIPETVTAYMLLYKTLLFSKRT